MVAQGTCVPRAIRLPRRRLLRQLHQGLARPGHMSSPRNSVRRRQERVLQRTWPASSASAGRKLLLTRR